LKGFLIDSYAISISSFTPSLTQLGQHIFYLGLAVEKLIEEGEPHPLRRLHTITLSVPPFSLPRDDFLLSMDFDFNVFVAVTSLLSQSPLENFHIYPTSSYPDQEHGFSLASELLWDSIVRAHAKTLRRVSIHQVLISFQALEMFCESCVKLEELFVVVPPWSVVSNHYLGFSSSMPIVVVCINRNNSGSPSRYPKPSGGSILTTLLVFPPPMTIPSQKL